MVIFAPEVHSFFLRPFVEYTQEQLGDKALEKILAKFGISQKDLSDYTAWISLEFCESFCLEVVKCFNEPNVVDYCARLAISPKYAGLIRPFFRTIGSPMFAYSQIMGATPRFNKVGEYKFEKIGSTSVRLTYKYLPGAPKEHSDIVCRARRAQFSSLATMFDIPQASVEHPKCLHKGDDACVYNVTWQEPRRSYIQWIFVLFSTLFGCLLSYLLYREFSFSFIALSGFIGWLVSRLLELKHQLTKRNDDLIKQQDALSIVTNTNDRRFEELLEAKNATERTVEERTRELRAATEQLKSLDELKSQFIANVSHELRTPLTLSIGPLESVLTDIKEGKHRSYLETVYRNQLRLTKLISDLLDFTKLEAGKVELRFTREDITQIIRDLASTVKAAMESRNMKLLVETPEHPVWVYVDRDKFEKITMNLLSNAFKFTPDQGQIHIRLLTYEDKATLQITDSGQGIPHDKLLTIFERFSQVDASKKRRYSGTGIGLAMVKEYTEMHGGTVTVESQLNHGSTFFVTLLRGKEHIDPKHVIDDQSSTSGLHSYQFIDFEQTRENSKLSKLPSPKIPADNVIDQIDESHNKIDKVLLQSFQRQASILIADDEWEIRDYLESLFKDQYPRIYTAKDGLEALKIAQEVTPDLILTDMMMPNMSGDELCLAIKNSPGQLGQVPVVILTARAELPLKVGALQQQVKDYITKPFNPTELQLRVRNILNEYYQGRALLMMNEKLHKSNRDLTTAHQKLTEKDQEREISLDLAQKYQQALLSLSNFDDLPKKLEYSLFFRPKEKVGGDLYNVYVASPTHVRVFLMDINDHDVHASMRTGTVFAHYNMIKEYISDPGDIFTKLNQIIMNTYKHHVAFSACCLDIHLQEGGGALLRYCSSSDIYMYIIRDGKAIEQPTEQCMLGILEDWDLYSTVETKMNDGEKLICFTDGLYQQKEPEKGQAFLDSPEYQESLERLNTCSTIAQVVQSLIDAWEAFRNDKKQNDDTTILGFELKKDNFTQPLHFSIPNGESGAEHNYQK